MLPSLVPMASIVVVAGGQGSACRNCSVFLLVVLKSGKVRDFISSSFAVVGSFRGTLFHWRPTQHLLAKTVQKDAVHVHFPSCFILHPQGGFAFLTRSRLSRPGNLTNQSCIIGCWGIESRRSRTVHSLCNVVLYPGQASWVDSWKD